MQLTLTRPLAALSIRRHLLLGAIVLWAIVTAPFAVHMATTGGRWWALVALVAGPTAWVVRRSPVAAAIALVLGATIPRFSFVGFSSSDPIPVAQHAASVAIAGGNPYESVYITPYSYGPLGLLWYQGGIPAEFIATLATSALLIWARAWMTLAFYNAWPQFLYTPMIGDSDYSVGFLLAAALVVLRFRPVTGMTLLAAAIAVKPYAAAWAIPAIGYAGVTAGVFAAAVTAVLWAPVFFLWGMASYLEATLRVDSLRHWQASLFPSWSFADAPLLRWLVIPLSLAGLVSRSWDTMVFLGGAGFVTFLGFSPWAHVANLAAVVPIVGLALEWRPMPGTIASVPGYSAGPPPRRTSPRRSRRVGLGGTLWSRPDHAAVEVNRVPSSITSAARQGVEAGTPRPHLAQGSPVSTGNPRAAGRRSYGVALNLLSGRDPPPPVHSPYPRKKRRPMNSRRGGKRRACLTSELVANLRSHQIRGHVARAIVRRCGVSRTLLKNTKTFPDVPSASRTEATGTPHMRHSHLPRGVAHVGERALPRLIRRFGRPLVGLCPAQAQQGTRHARTGT